VLPENGFDKEVALIEQFTILLYDRIGNMASTDEARQELFTKKGRAMAVIPPNKAALVQHIKRLCIKEG